MANNPPSLVFDGISDGSIINLSSCTKIGSYFYIPAIILLYSGTCRIAMMRSSDEQNWVELDNVHSPLISSEPFATGAAKSLPSVRYSPNDTDNFWFGCAGVNTSKIACVNFNIPTLQWGTVSDSGYGSQDAGQNTAITIDILSNKTKILTFFAGGAGNEDEYGLIWSQHTFLTTFNGSWTAPIQFDDSVTGDTEALHDLAFNQSTCLTINDVLYMWYYYTQVISGIPQPAQLRCITWTQTGGPGASQLMPLPALYPYPDGLTDNPNSTAFYDPVDDSVNTAVTTSDVGGNLGIVFIKGTPTITTTVYSCIALTDTYNFTASYPISVPVITNDGSGTYAVLFQSSKDFISFEFYYLISSNSGNTWSSYTYYGNTLVNGWPGLTNNTTGDLTPYASYISIHAPGGKVSLVTGFSTHTTPLDINVSSTLFYFPGPVPITSFNTAKISQYRALSLPS